MLTGFAEAPMGFGAVAVAKDVLGLVPKDQLEVPHRGFGTGASQTGGFLEWKLV